MTRTPPILVAALLSLLAAACASPDSGGASSAGGGGVSTARTGDTGAGSGTATAPRQVQTPRQSTDKRGLYALPELRNAARTLVERIGRGAGAERPRVALSRFSLRNRKSAIGESIARDLATLLVEEAGEGVEIFTRRKLTDAARELKRQQSDLFDQDTMVRLGRFSGVHSILIGHLDDRDPGALRCNCQILDVETAEIRSGARFSIPLASLTVPVHGRDDGAAEGARRLLANRVDAERELGIGAFGTTRNGKDFPPGTDFVGELSTELADDRSGKVRVYTRRDIDRAVAELTLEASDLFDETTQAEIGNFVGADCVLTGFAETYRKFYKFNVVLIDVETSRVLSGAILCVKRQ